MPVVLTPPLKRWSCPSCGAEHETREALPHIPMHSCSALRGCSVPFVEAGSDARHRVVEREDYVGSEQPYMVDGRPVMAVLTERADGSNDCHAFAVVATAAATVNAE